jgi:hypothetical protein
MEPGEGVEATGMAVLGKFNVDGGDARKLADLLGQAPTLVAGGKS